MGNVGLRHGRWVGAVVGVLLLAGCGARTAPGVQPSAAAAGEQEGGGQQDQDQDQELAVSASPGQEAPADPAGEQSPAGEAPDQPPGESEDPEELVTEVPPPEDKGMSIDVAHPCVSPGGRQVITLHAPPRAGVTMIIGYADRQTYGQQNHGVADDQGRYVWTIIVPLTAPEGPAAVGATSTGADWLQSGGGEGGGTARDRFEVRRAGECPSP